MPTLAPPQADAETENSPQSEFPSLEETQESLSKLAAKPPSPMPIPNLTTKETESPQPETESAFPAKSLKEFEHLKDYKKRSFDPRLHRVKANGEPELTAEGKLKILPPSKRGVLDSVKSFFSHPKSDHEISEEQEAKAHAQARSVAEFEEMEAGANFWTGLYFLFGNTILSSGFSSTKKDRESEIRGLFLNYEKQTGKTFDPPPGVALALGLSMDFATTIATVPECRERVDLYKNAVVSSTVQGVAKRSWLGRTTGKVVSFFLGGRNPKEKASGKPQGNVEMPPEAAPQFPNSPES